MGNKIEQFNLGPGTYSFRHQTLGRVSLEVGASSVNVHGEREERDSLGEPSFVQTVRQGVSAVTVKEAFGALPRDLQGVLINFQVERQVEPERDTEVVVFDSRAHLTLQERRAMASTGRIPALRRVFKADSF